MPKKLQIYLGAEGQLVSTLGWQVSIFLDKVGKPFVNDLMMDTEKAMEEMSLLLSAFEILNPRSVNKSPSQRKQLSTH